MNLATCLLWFFSFSDLEDIYKLKNDPLLVFINPGRENYVIKMGMSRIGRGSINEQKKTNVDISDVSKPISFFDNAKIPQSDFEKTFLRYHKIISSYKKLQESRIKIRIASVTTKIAEEPIKVYGKNGTVKKSKEMQ